MPERHLTIQALMRAVEQCEELKTKWYTYMSQKSGDATYVAKSDKDKVIDFVTMLLKEIDKPMAVAEALAKLEDVEHKDGQRVQEFFNAYAAALMTSDPRGVQPATGANNARARGAAARYGFGKKKKEPEASKIMEFDVFDGLELWSSSRGFRNGA